MIAQSFDYVVATSLAEAVGLLQKNPGAKILAGGHSLIPMMKLRLATPECLIDIGRIPELSYVREDGGSIRIGALTTHHEIESSSVLHLRCQTLADAAEQIGDIQVRNKGTIGGSLAHADPAADYPASILALDAVIVALGPKGERKIPASDFFVDMLTTALQPDELLREIQIPVRTGRVSTAYAKMEQKASGFALAGVSAVVEVDDAGAIANVTIGITGVASRAYRALEVEKALRGMKPTTELLRKAAEHAAIGVTPLEDIHASAEYRLALARIFTRRAVSKALERLGS